VARSSHRTMHTIQKLGYMVVTLTLSCHCAPYPLASNVQNGALIALGAGCVAVALVAVARRRSTQQYTALPDVAVEPCTHAASVGTQMTPNMVETASEKTPLVV